MPARFFAGAGPIRLDINADTTNFNIFTQAGSPSDPVSVVVTVGTGVKVGHMNTASGWAAGSKIRIRYAGARITAPGGDGGAGANYRGTAGNGTDGGDALTLGWDVELDHGGTGELFGGGAGGGGSLSRLSNEPGGCGGGGGGQGYPMGNGGAHGTGAPNGQNGANATETARGNGGADGVGSGSGGKGGSFGADGVNGSGAGGAAPGGLAGVKGNAIKTNGHAVTWIGGAPDSAHLKGPIS